MSKCFQAIDKLKLDTDNPAHGQRPKGLGMISCVGEEYVAFKKPLPLEDKVGAQMEYLRHPSHGNAIHLCLPAAPTCIPALPCFFTLCVARQVEKYMNDIVGKMRSELRDVLRDSVTDYTTKPRYRWLFDWPSQVILVVNQIFWCQEVEQVSTDALATTTLCVFVPAQQSHMLRLHGSTCWWQCYMQCCCSLH